MTGTLPQMPADTPVRLRIEQISAVDHAIVAGVPRVGDDGSVVLGPGPDRPLVLTTLELDEAMRVLAGGRRNELMVAAGLLVAAPPVMLAGLVTLLLRL